MSANAADQAGPSSSVYEEDTSRSLAATLKLARAKGYVDETKKKEQRAVISSAKRAKLEVKSMIEDKREDTNRRGGGRDHRAHHTAGRGPRGNAQLREVKESLDYKPEINLEYTDDSGRKLQTPKEQFNYMCYKFHGKGPSKNKIDKRLKKKELESKMKDCLSTDVPGSAALMISKQKELQTPYIVLSKGK